jgi:hypothetical protein
MCCRSKQQRQVERLEQGRHAHSGPQAGVGSKRPSFDGRPDYVDRTVPRVSPSIGEASRQSLSESAPPAYASIEKASGPYDTVASDQAHSIPADAGRSVALKRHGRGVAYAESTVCNELGHKVYSLQRIRSLADNQEKRRYGTVGIIGGIVFFPWGLFW